MRQHPNSTRLAVRKLHEARLRIDDRDISPMVDAVLAALLAKIAANAPQQRRDKAGQFLTKERAC